MIIHLCLGPVTMPKPKGRGGTQKKHNSSKNGKRKKSKEKGGEKKGSERKEEDDVGQSSHVEEDNKRKVVDPGKPLSHKAKRKSKKELERKEKTSSHHTQSTGFLDESKDVPNVVVGQSNANSENVNNINLFSNKDNSGHHLGYNDNVISDNSGQHRQQGLENPQRNRTMPNQRR